jgi:hypothetical protein
LYNFEDATQVEKLLEGSSILEKVVLMELGCLTVNSLFDQWISGVVQRCPNLRYLVVHCGVSQLEYGMNTLQMLDKVSNSLLKLMCKLSHVVDRRVVYFWKQCDFCFTPPWWFYLQYLVMDSGREFTMFNYQWHPYQVGYVIWLAYSRIRVLGLTKMNLWNNRYAWYIELVSLPTQRRRIQSYNYICVVYVHSWNPTQIPYCMQK